MKLPPFPRGDNYEIAKIHWQNLKIFSSRTTWPIKLSTKHPWVKGIQVSANKGIRPFPRGDNLAQKHPYVRGIQVCSNEKPFNSQKVDNGFYSSLNQHYDIIICVYWFELFFSGERCGKWASCFIVLSIVYFIYKFHFSNPNYITKDIWILSQKNLLWLFMLSTSNSWF